MSGQSSLIYSLNLVDATLLIAIPTTDETRQLVHITNGNEGDGLYERLTDGSFVKVGGDGVIVGGGTLNYIPKFTPDGITIGNSQIFDNGTSLGVNTVLPSAKARLQINSTTQGVLFPRVTTVQRNAIAPALSDAGLWVFNTSTNLFNYWDGAVWQEVDSTASGEWMLDGNSNGTERYIGTNDTFDFPIVVDGVETARFTVGGNLDGSLVWNASTISISKGGTGQVTANAALNALLPNQATHAGKFLQTNGTNTSWIAGNNGTVTSVSITTNQGVSGIVGTPTTTPNITLSLGVLTGVTSLNGLVVTPNTGVITSGTWNGTAIGVDYGGTGLTNYSVGDLIYASGVTTLSKLSDVAIGSFLVSGGIGIAPSWQSIGSSSLAITGGGTTNINATNKLFASFYSSSNATATAISYSNIIDGATVTIDYLKTTATDLAITFPEGTVVSISSAVAISGGGLIATLTSTVSGRFTITIININGVYKVYIVQDVA